MKQLVTHAGSGNLDASTRDLLAIEASCLMEKASIRLWDALVRQLSDSADFSGHGIAGRSVKKIPLTALCGKGDNGGDALAMLRHAFSDGWEDLAAILPSNPPGELAARQMQSLEAAGIPCFRWLEDEQDEAFSRLSSGGIILDGILGTGCRGEATGDSRRMIEKLSSLKKRVSRPMIVSVDIPSGLCDGWASGMPVVHADLTLCLDPMKLSCFIPEARTACGSIVPVSGVFPERLAAGASVAQLLEEKDLDGLIGPVPASAFKMSRGRLAVFAGSKSGAGAAMLASKAGLASGAGYVTLHVDEELYPLIAPTLESVIVRVCTRAPEVGSVDAILAGPGWGKDETRLPLLEALLDSSAPLVLDADGIRLFAQLLARGWKRRPEGAPLAFTPHPGELQALQEAISISDPQIGSCGFKDRLQAIADRCGALILAKSHVTWMVLPGVSGSAVPEGIAVWDGNQPELGTAGSGDVLAGLFAGLAARNSGRNAPASASPWTCMANAAKAALIVHAVAGKRLSRAEGWFEAASLTGEASRLLHGAGQSRNA